MSRSHKKHPFIGTTSAKSEKKDKRIVNRQVRHKVNQALKYPDKFDENALYLKKEDISDIWDFAKDGKHRVDKNSEFYKKTMRK
jgi:hypothetical protein